MLWLTDMHRSRPYSGVLEKLRAIGVHLVVWLPNYMSKMQLPDVTMFGPLKKCRDKTERQWQTRNPMKEITREDKIRFAGEALVRSCHRTVLEWVQSE